MSVQGSIVIYNVSNELCILSESRSRVKIFGTGEKRGLGHLKLNGISEYRQCLVVRTGLLDILCINAIASSERFRQGHLRRHRYVWSMPMNL